MHQSEPVRCLQATSECSLLEARACTDRYRSGRIVVVQARPVGIVGLQGLLTVMYICKDLCGSDSIGPPARNTRSLHVHVDTCTYVCIQTLIASGVFQDRIHVSTFNMLTDPEKGV
jgi:hypothetical protein